MYPEVLCLRAHVSEKLPGCEQSAPLRRVVSDYLLYGNQLLALQRVGDCCVVDSRGAADSNIRE
jgi:hypothetical protein